MWWNNLNNRHVGYGKMTSKIISNDQILYGLRNERENFKLFKI